MNYDFRNAHMNEMLCNQRINSIANVLSVAQGMREHLNDFVRVPVPDRTYNTLQLELKEDAPLSVYHEIKAISVAVPRDIPENRVECPITRVRRDRAEVIELMFIDKKNQLIYEHYLVPDNLRFTTVSELMTYLDRVAGTGSTTPTNSPPRTPIRTPPPVNEQVSDTAVSVEADEDEQDLVSAIRGM